MTESHRINSEPVFLLSTTPWKESSLLAEVFSQNYGRVVLLARSARKRQSDLRGVLVPFVPINLSWYGKQEIKTLHRAEWIGKWPQPVGKVLFSAMYVNELILKLTAREDTNPKLYQALHDVMKAICSKVNHLSDLRAFEWRLLTILGYAPDSEKDMLGLKIQADKNYYLDVEKPLQPISNENNHVTSLSKKIIVNGSTIMQLATNQLSNEENIQESIKITRFLLNFYLPEGIQSRKVLQQLQAFQKRI